MLIIYFDMNENMPYKNLWHSYIANLFWHIFVDLKSITTRGISSKISHLLYFLRVWLFREKSYIFFILVKSLIMLLNSEYRKNDLSASIRDLDVFNDYWFFFKTYILIAFVICNSYWTAIQGRFIMIFMLLHYKSIKIINETSLPFWIWNLHNANLQNAMLNHLEFEFKIACWILLFSIT